MLISPALIIGLERLLGRSLDEYSWLKGVIIAVIGSLCASVGYCLQNLSQKNNFALPIQKQVPATHQSLNLIGIGLVVIEAILECLALAYANESLLASIGLTSLAFNAIFSPIINGEKSTYKDWIVVFTIMAGVLITISSGPHIFQLLNLVQIFNLLHKPAFHMFLIVVVSWTFTLIYLTMVLDPADAFTGQLSSLSRSQRYEFHRLCLCALAGSLAGLAIALTRGMVSLIALSIEEQNQFSQLGSWLLVLGTLIVNVASIITLNHAVGLYENLYVIPIKAVFEVIISVSAGIFFYEESLTLTYTQVIVFIIGLLVCLAGLIIMLIAADRLPALEAAYLGLKDISIDIHENQGLITRKIQI